MKIHHNLLKKHDLANLKKEVHKLDIDEPAELDADQLEIVLVHLKNIKWCSW